MPDEKADISPTPDPKFILRSRKMELDAGLLGRIIGSPKNAPNNLAFLVIVLAFLTGLGLSVAYSTQWLEFWKLIVPIITLAMGYVFGKSSNS
jgi:hypothetical protein